MRESTWPISAGISKEEGWSDERKEMRLNFRTEQDGWIKVELVHPPVTPPREVKAFDGFSVEDAEILSGDERSRIVRWQGENDLSPLKDREVSIRLHMHRARVFSTFL